MLFYGQITSQVSKITKEVLNRSSRLWTEGLNNHWVNIHSLYSSMRKINWQTLLSSTQGHSKISSLPTLTFRYYGVPAWKLRLFSGSAQIWFLRVFFLVLDSLLFSDPSNPTPEHSLLPANCTSFCTLASQFVSLVLLADTRAPQSFTFHILLWFSFPDAHYRFWSQTYICSWIFASTYTLLSFSHWFPLWLFASSCFYKLYFSSGRQRKLVSHFWLVLSFSGNFENLACL